MILFFTSSTTVILAQQKLVEKKYYTWFDQNISQDNIDLFNGEIYKKTYRTEHRNHNFFLNSDYALGVVMFNNQKYYDIPLKYDIYEDELIANLKNSATGESIVQLNKAFVQEFTLYNKDFVFLNVTNESIVMDGFYEISYKGNNIKLYTKHRKLERSYISKGTQYNKFFEKNENFILFEHNYYEINHKKDLQKIFPTLKKEINTIYKSSNRSLKNSDYNAFIKRVIQQIHQHIE